MLLTTFWKQQSFWVAVVTAIFVILNEGLGLGVNEAAIWPVVLLILGWVFKDGVVEMSVKSAAIRSEGYAAAARRLKENS